MAAKPNNDNAAADVASAKNTRSSQLEASNAERHAWLIKCPPIVSRAMQNNHLPPPCSADGAKDPITNSGPTVAKITVSVDPLLPNNDVSSNQLVDCCLYAWAHCGSEFVEYDLDLELL
ncbi:Transcription initiation factor IIF subunit beta [Abeliophyllum distichum]|uniref:Transcription initiation factor IIF subunit beta n=1 Tax=Abeliophyllum distichum TaxID=126358 RepID=A0ABD1VQW2_9LAMI